MMFFCCGKAEYASREQRTRSEFVAAASGFVVEREAPRPRARSMWGALDSPGDSDRYGRVEAVSIPSPPSESARPRPLKPPPYSVAVAVKSGDVLPSSPASPIISHKPPQAVANTVTGTATGTRPQGVAQSVEALVTKRERPESSLPVRPERESFYRDDDSRVGGSWTSLRERVRETKGSVAGESVRPSWYYDVGSEPSSPRYQWDSKLTGSVAPGWSEETDSVVAESEGPDWNVETRSVATESVAAESVRPSWIEETASAFGETDRTHYRDRWMDNDLEIPSLGSRTPVSLNATKMSRAKSSDPQAPLVTVRIKTSSEDGLGPSDKSSSRTSTKPSLFGSGTHEKRSDGGRSDSQVSDVGHGKGVAHVQVQVIKRGSTPGSNSTKRASRLEAPPPFKEPEDPTAPTATKEVQEAYKTRSQMQRQTPFGSNSPKGTMGGQSSSEHAARPWIELADPFPENPEDRGKARTAPQLGTDNASMGNKQSSQSSHEGPRLNLVKGTSSTSSTSSGSKHESLGNGNGGKRERRTHRHTISPSKRLGQDSQDLMESALRAQPPRQATSEVPRKVSIPSGKVSLSEKNGDGLHSAGKVFRPVPRRGESPAPLRPSPGKATTKGSRVGRVLSSSPSPARDHDNGPEKPNRATTSSPLKDGIWKFSHSGGSKITTTSSSPAASTVSEGKPLRHQRGRSPGHDNAGGGGGGGVRFVGIDYSDSDDSTNSTAMKAKSANGRRKQLPRKRPRPGQEPRADSADTPVFTPTDKPGETLSKEARPSIKLSPTQAPTAQTSAAAVAAAVGTLPGVLKMGPTLTYKAPTPQPHPKQHQEAKAITAGPSSAAPLVTPLNKKYTTGLRRSSWVSRRRNTPDLESVEEEALDNFGGGKHDGDDVDQVDDRDKHGEHKQKPSSERSASSSSSRSTSTGGANASTIPRVAPAERPKRSSNTRLPSYDSGSGMLGSSAVGALARPGGDGASADDLPAKWVRRRRDHRLQTLLSKDDSSRSYRRGSQRLSQSSSFDDSTDVHQLQLQQPRPSRNMFSPNRFNPDAGALSWCGSWEGSWCNDSVRSFMTGGRNSSATSLASGRGPSDRKLVAPQLSYKEKKEVARLKIDRADVHFGYRPVRGSRQVFKIELQGEMRAAKMMSMLRLPKEAVSEVLETFDAELLALSRLSTPNIVKVYGASVRPGGEMIVVSEFVEGGTLRDLLDNTPKLKHLNTRMRLSIARDVAAGMKSLYAHGMQHRHLSSKTVLLTNQLQAKVYGFGLSMTSEMLSYFNSNDEDERSEDDLLWESREVLVGAGFSEKSDVYSFGIVLWEIMQADGSLPYKGLRSHKVKTAKYNGEGPSIPRNTLPEISSLMESCWSNLPVNRPSFDKIYQFFTDLAGVKAGAGEDSSDPPNGAMSVP